MKTKTIFNDEDRWFEDASLCRLLYTLGNRTVSVLSIKDCPEHADVDAHSESVAEAYETDLDLLGITCLCYPPWLTTNLALQ